MCPPNESDLLLLQSQVNRLGQRLDKVEGMLDSLVDHKIREFFDAFQKGLLSAIHDGVQKLVKAFPDNVQATLPTQHTNPAPGKDSPPP